MESIKFECENISIKMNGANLNKEELRPASFKGVMRFWWRAINGDLRLDDLRKKEGKIFGDTNQKSSFSIKIPMYKEVPKDFTIEFIKSKKCDFDIKSFFELVVILGGFGKSAKKKDKGKVKILKIKKNNKEWKSYTEPQELENILKLLQKFNKKFKIENNEIISIDFNFTYPMIHQIWIENNILNVKLKENKIFQRVINE